jgi:hypothetical protein
MHITNMHIGSRILEEFSLLVEKVSHEALVGLGCGGFQVKLVTSPGTKGLEARHRFPMALVVIAIIAILAGQSSAVLPTLSEGMGYEDPIVPPLAWVPVRRGVPA